ncbi:MAG: CdaR family protein [Verrucomicrobiia bacterium]
MITKNLGRKIGSFLIAIFIWIAIYSSQHDVRLGARTATAVRTFPNHPITVLKIATDSYGYRIVPSNVDVTLKGPAKLLNSLTEKDIEVYINLTDVVDVVKVKKKVLIFTPEGINIVDVNPPFVTVERVE